MAGVGIGNQGDVPDRGREARYGLEHFMTNGEGQQVTQVDFKEINRFFDIVGFGHLRVQLADYSHPLLVYRYRCLSRRMQAGVVARLESGGHPQPV